MNSYSVPTQSTMVAYFTGSLAQYRGNQTGEAPADPADLTYHFGYLSDCIHLDETYVKGSHGNSSAYGIFAFDIENPVDEWLVLLKQQAEKQEKQAKEQEEQVKEQEEQAKKNDAKKITLVINAFSRGTLSALLLAKKIQQDSNLRDRVNVILNLQDPVPGNFNLTARMDKSELTVAKQAYDLRDCTCIKEAHISVFEEGVRYRDVQIPAFDVLLPKFASTTACEIEYLPGTHTITGKDPRALEYDDKHQIYLAHPLISQLNLYKALQIYCEQDVSIDFDNTIKKIKEINQKIDDESLLNHNYKNILKYRRYLSFLIDRYFSSTLPIDKHTLYIFLLKIQSFIYELLLDEFKHDDNVLNRTRDIHGGVKAGKTNISPNFANYLNPRHRTIENILEDETELEDETDLGLATLISQLDLFKTLQISCEQKDVSVNFEAAIKKIQVSLFKALQIDDEQKDISINFENKITKIQDNVILFKHNNIAKYCQYLSILMKRYFSTLPIDKDTFHIFLLTIQDFIYKLLLNKCKIDDNKLLNHIRNFLISGKVSKREGNTKHSSDFYPNYLLGIQENLHRGDIDDVHSIVVLNKCALLRDMNIDEDASPLDIYEKYESIKDSVYVRTKDKLFYLNTKTKECIEIKMDKQRSTELDKEIYKIFENADNLARFNIKNKTEIVEDNNGIQQLRLSRTDVDKIVKITGHKPVDEFSQRYQRIMHILQKTTSKCKISSLSKYHNIENKKLTYIEKLKSDLFSIASDKNLSDIQKILAMDCCIVNIHRDLKRYEGFTKSRLRKKLEAMMSANSILGFKKHYGMNIDTTDHEIKACKMRNLSHFLNQAYSDSKEANLQLPYKELAEMDPILFKKIIKCINEVDMKHHRDNQKMIGNLKKFLKGEPLALNQNDAPVTLPVTLNDFKYILFCYYHQIRSSEKKGGFPFFLDNSSHLGNIIERFMRTELDMKVPHVYSNITKGTFENTLGELQKKPTTIAPNL